MSDTSKSTIDRRRFVHLLGVGGLVIAAGPSGIRRLDGADALAASLEDPFSPHAYVKLHDDGTRVHRYSCTIHDGHGCDGQCGPAPAEPAEQLLSGPQVRAEEPAPDVDEEIDL